MLALSLLCRDGHFLMRGGGAPADHTNDPMEASLPMKACFWLTYRHRQRQCSLLVPGRAKRPTQLVEGDRSCWGGMGSAIAAMHERDAVGRKFGADIRV